MGYKIHDGPTILISPELETQIHGIFLSFLNLILFILKMRIKERKWCDSMDEEMQALEKNETWELVNLPARK